MERAEMVAPLTAGQDVSTTSDALNPATQSDERSGAFVLPPGGRAAVARPLHDDGWASIPLLPEVGGGLDALLEGDLDPWGDQGRGLLLNVAVVGSTGVHNLDEVRDAPSVW
jgi:hypothetical protein